MGETRIRIVLVLDVLDKCTLFTAVVVHRTARKVTDFGSVCAVEHGSRVLTLHGLRNNVRPGSLGHDRCNTDLVRPHRCAGLRVEGELHREVVDRLEIGQSWRRLFRVGIEGDPAGAESPVANRLVGEHDVCARQRTPVRPGVIVADRLRDRPDITLLHRFHRQPDSDVGCDEQSGICDREQRGLGRIMDIRHVDRAARADEVPVATRSHVRGHPYGVGEALNRRCFGRFCGLASWSSGGLGDRACRRGGVITGVAGGRYESERNQEHHESDRATSPQSSQDLPPCLSAVLSAAISAKGSGPLFPSRESGQ